MDQTKKYDTILFDWDGTLAQTIDIWEEAFHNVFDSLHMPINIDQATEKLWLDSAILNDFGIEHEGFFDLVYEKLSQNYTKTTLYQGTIDLLIKLKEKNIKLALVTSTRRKPVLEALVYHQLSLYFQIVVASEDVVSHKPSGEPYEMAMNQLGSSKDNSLIVGDSKFDLIASQNAQIDSVLFLPGENEKHYKKEELLIYKPKYIINELSKILEIIDNNYSS
ncbi:hypothetical protein COX08_03780 [Candidatus Beckwithbacteria bacterium CG23_combo_of_CG06-09_8_20_14_all_34_8]|uniref:HAD family hydrolase n=1 Tax=Candidatus Beckwithbacteria bacterium CG23_combo_of_CG06-09_8_20_14_all_34_8 TaxID=1974497 RepID=A0A2H0B5K0_9BACT|nr:MAG: hypothetical protein COX08_03780 [Candidatus Beckwithbacteria bacterium CG23_combo_of_CG06-09_8_20_14_all_34_8]